jgi:hypothetical protein
VRNRDWTQFTPAQRRFLLRFFMLMRWDQDGPFDQERWRAIAAHVPRLERCVHDVPEPYTDQYLNDVGSVLSGMKRPAEIRDPSGTCSSSGTRTAAWFSRQRTLRF